MNEGEEAPTTKPIKFPSNKRQHTQKHSWGETFQELKTYQAKNGNCNVPFRKEGLGKLGQWVTKQKRNRNQLTIEQINELDSIGFNWKKLDQRNEDRWMEIYKRLQDYRRKKGDCQVIALYKPDLVLGGWVSYQRGLNKKGKLSEDRFKLLSRLDFIWHLKDPGDRKQPLHDKAFKDMYDRLVAFHQTNGHCLVPFTYKDDKKLAGWVANQRRIYDDGEMKAERIMMLENIGFVWKVDVYSAEASLSQRHWDEMFKELSRFVDENGHSQVTVHNTPDGYNEKLGMWVGMQRMLHRQGDVSLTPERKKRLESIDFWWGSPGNNHRDEPYLDKIWKRLFRKLNRYRKKRGHTLVSVSDDKRIKMLENIGFVWKVDAYSAIASLSQRHWDEMFEELSRFKDENGHSQVPVNNTPDRYNEKLGTWVSMQRMLHRQGHVSLTPERKKRIESIGFWWGSPDNNHQDEPFLNKL
eukprot:CAMPEP_0194159868 /NCGR_PEP_ID=MMETSP0152-20130528/78070_1 /TAXON_ID=1049557 /ORGANISM="Thalassiothrix antarctica, Strain L6-D1" /LENGTH=466 /DNA_ID=CAMNT_0038869493 /DNA_START=134 /DNA_END=1534 /DNA_ORIENTATION=-